MNTVLILSTYPVGDARHGGQVRLANIIEIYNEDGWNTFPVCVPPEEGYQDVRGARAIPFPVSSPHRLYNGRKVHFIDDLLTGQFVVSDEAAWNHLLSILPREIDAIHVEQPWLWPVAEKIREMPQYQAAVLVYGSQNLEEELKRRILAPYASADSDRAVQAVGELERHATKAADLVLAVTAVEKQVLTSWGANAVELTPNGITPWKAEEDALREWEGKLPVAPWLLYVASAHPPNFDGFAELLGGSLGCFPPDSALVVAGTVSEHIYHQLNATRWRSLNLSRIRLLYSLSNRDLNAVKSLAHGFFLPVSYGSGSNIKTAEALFSGKYVVATSVALRGYDEFASLPEVRVANNPRAIHDAVREVLELPSISSEEALGETSGRQALTWKHALKGLPPAVRAAISRSMSVDQQIA